MHYTVVGAFTMISIVGLGVAELLLNFSVAATVQ